MPAARPRESAPHLGTVCDCAVRYPRIWRSARTGDRGDDDHRAAGDGRTGRGGRELRGADRSGHARSGKGVEDMTEKQDATTTVDEAPARPKRTPRPPEYYEEIKRRFAAERDLRLSYRPEGTAQYNTD